MPGSGLCLRCPQEMERLLGEGRLGRVSNNESGF